MSTTDHFCFLFTKANVKGRFIGDAADQVLCEDLTWVDAGLQGDKAKEFATRDDAIEFAKTNGWKIANP